MTTTDFDEVLDYIIGFDLSCRHVGHYLTNFDEVGEASREIKAKGYRLAAETLGLNIVVCEHPMPRDWEDYEARHYVPDPRMWSLYWNGPPGQDLSEFWTLAKKMTSLCLENG